jgi:hypothetical protein
MLAAAHPTNRKTRHDSCSFEMQIHRVLSKLRGIWLERNFGVVVARKIVHARCKFLKSFDVPLHAFSSLLVCDWVSWLANNVVAVRLVTAHQYDVELTILNLLHEAVKHIPFFMFIAH